MKVEKIGEDVVNEEGVMIKRATMIFYHDNGTKVTCIPPDPYPSKEEQAAMLDRLYELELSAIMRRMQETFTNEGGNDNAGG